MPTPKAGYFIDGVRIPSVTTITGKFKDSGGIIYWSWDIAFQGLVEARALLEDSFGDGLMIKQAKEFLKRPLSDWDYKQKRDTAADAGTCAHDMMDSFVHKREFEASKYKPELIEMARPAFEAFLEWVKGCNFTIVESEQQLLSRKYRFGGTRDAILVNGKRSMCDYKTSNDVYPEYLCQLAAYGLLDEENGGIIDGGYHLLKFSKQKAIDDPIRFTHFYFSQLDVARSAFLLMRELYDNMKRLEGMLK
jgi:hypothetical protein